MVTTSIIEREAGRVEFGDQKFTAHWEIDYMRASAQIRGKLKGLIEGLIEVAFTGEWEKIRFLRDDELEIACQAFVESVLISGTDVFTMDLMIRELPLKG